ncbi:MAG: DegT/DnrJ/EryC1/StrS family aminotransferase [Hyphomicrobiales bacterium]|nr:MAG: DegT/DnrJ/EryC1/StrS family aminotransferase [Hyphomicrobiales bacterium]
MDVLTNSQLKHSPGKHKSKLAEQRAFRKRLDKAFPLEIKNVPISRRAGLAAFGGEPVIEKGQIVPWPAACKKHAELLASVVSSGKYHRVNHPIVTKLEQRLAAWSNWWDVRAVGSGTSAVHIGLDYFRNRGPKVVTAALNWPGAVGPIGFSNMTPEFVDVDLSNAAINQEAAANRVTNDVGVVLITHLFGNFVDAEKLREVSRKNGAAIVDDVAQSIAAIKVGDGQHPLNSDVLALSGNGAKHLGAGELGFVLSRDPDLIEHVDRVSLTSSSRNGERVFSPNTSGYNYRPNVFSSAIASSRVKKLDQQLKHRRKNCFSFWSKAKHCEGLLPIFNPDDMRNSFLNLPLRIDTEVLDLPANPIVRDYIVNLLRAEGVPVLVWLTKPVFDYLPKWQGKWSATDFPNTQLLLDTMFYLSEIAPPNNKALMQQYANAFEKVWAALPSLKQEIRRSVFQ